MTALFWFIMGFLVGYLIGILTFAILIANDDTEWDDD